MPSSRTFLWLAAVAAAATTTLSSGAAAAAAPRATTESPGVAAAGWLSQQFSDHLDYPGAAYFDGGTTADSIYALAAAGVAKHKIDSAITYFAKHVSDYTSVKDGSGAPGPYDGAIGKAAVAALVAGADPTHFGGYNLLRALKTDQCTVASAPKNDKDLTTPVCPAAGAARNIYSSVSESFAILSEARGAARYGSAYAPDPAAMKYFLSLQCADGGFTSNTAGGRGCASDPDATGYAMMALQAVGHDGPAIDRAARWLVGVRNADGSWTAQHVHNVDSTGIAAAALDAQGADTARSTAWLAGQQVTSGPTVGAGASRGALKYHGTFDPSASIKATADGILGMVANAGLATLTDAHATPAAPVLALAAPAVAHAHVAAGHAQTVTGTGFAAGETVVGELHSSPVRVGRAIASKAGTVRLTFTVPSGLAGRHEITLTGTRSGLATTASFRVAAGAQVPASPVPSAPAASPALADTGQDSHQLGVETFTGVTAIALGTLVLLLGRRRARHR